MYNNSRVKFHIYPWLSLILLVILPSLHYSQQSFNDILSAENRLKFGNYLFCQKDYLRAADEYREYLKISNNDTLRFKIGYSLFKLGRFHESMDNYKSLFYNSALTDEAKLQFIKIKFLLNDFADFRSIIDQKNYSTNNYPGIETKLYQLSLLFDDLVTDSLLFINSFDQDEKNVMLKFYMQRKYPGYKNETTAGILSAIIPGLGKIYADETGDGITSFILTYALSFLSYNNFKNDHNTRGWIFAGLAAYFYAGNIYGSLSAVQNYNAALNFRFDSDLRLYLSQKNYFIHEPDFLCK
ncbi:MAG: hypothetical protein JW995_10200 [Melioribacteraceae bacterium]|nr:hypothetical protein [Melioribacteraceae bacterium]